MKPCPRCGSREIHKVEYSRWGGIVDPVLVHQVRCKKCGKTYDGAAVTNITKRVATFVALIQVILFIIVISKYFF